MIVKPLVAPTQVFGSMGGSAVFLVRGARHSAGLEDSGGTALAFVYNDDNTDDYATTPIELGEWSLVEIWHDGGFIAISVNGGVTATTLSGNTVQMSNSGQYTGQAATSNYYNGYYGDRVAYNRKLDTAEADETRLYLRYKWGLL